MAFANDDSILDIHRDAGYISHLKAKIAAQERHMDWLQDRLHRAKRQRLASFIGAGLTVAACLAILAAGGAI